MKSIVRVKVICEGSTYLGEAWSKIVYKPLDNRFVYSVIAEMMMDDLKIMCLRECTAGGIALSIVPDDQACQGQHVELGEERRPYPGLWFLWTNLTYTGVELR